MIECRELAGKVIRRCQIDKDGKDGPEIHIVFTDETVLSVCLKTDVSIETRRASDGRPMRLVRDRNEPGTSEETQNPTP
jgi:hypothetical protein